MNAMGIGVGDFDRDLRLDLALSNIEATRLLQNGGASFATWPDARRRPPVQRAAAVGDLGRLLRRPQPRRLGGPGRRRRKHRRRLGPGRRNPTQRVFVNSGDGKPFRDCAVRVAPMTVARKGVALADYDRDGDMDMYVVNQEGTPSLYRNVTPRESSLARGRARRDRNQPRRVRREAGAQPWGASACSARCSVAPRASVRKPADGSLRPRRGEPGRPAHDPVAVGRATGADTVGVDHQLAVAEPES